MQGFSGFVEYLRSSLEAMLATVEPSSKEALVRWVPLELCTESGNQRL
jgi:hypothetical protein